METPDNNTDSFQTADLSSHRIATQAHQLGLSAAEIINQAQSNGCGVVDSDWVFDLAAEVTAGVPDEAWSMLSTDLARNFDHYHYGHPRGA